jgi:MYXO-CTERM domain-containing protein
MDAVLARRGFVAVLGLRLVPLVPFTVLNYAAGLSAVRWSHYIAATALGIVPGTVALVALGAYGSTPASVPFVSAALGLLVLSALGAWAVRRRNQMPSGEQDG